MSSCGTNARRRKARRAAFAAMLVVLTLNAPGAFAGDRGNRNDQRNDHDGGGLTADQAAAVVKRTYDGRVVSVKPEGGNGYKVRVLLEGGRVKTVQVDSRGNVRDAN